MSKQNHLKQKKGFRNKFLHYPINMFQSQFFVIDFEILLISVKFPSRKDPSRKVAGYDSKHCHRRKDRSSEHHCRHRRPSDCAIWPCRKIRRPCTNSKHAAPRYRRSLRHAPVSVLEATSRLPS